MFIAILRSLIERMLAVVLAILFFLPLSLTTVRHLRPYSKMSRWLDRMWIGVPGMAGATEQKPDVRLSWRSLRKGEFQKRKALLFDENFAGREALIRYTNELWFRVFDDTGNLAATIAVGQRDVLFGKTYLREYFLTRTSRAALEPWIKNLRKLQDFCRNRGMGFAVAMAPGKPSIYPEDTPLAWQRWYDPRPRAYELIKELFRENDIIFVDGVQIVRREKAKGPPAPLFPKGGVHWNDRCAYLVANAVQARFAQQNKPAEQIEMAESTISNNPVGADRDLLRLMNLVQTWHYPCELIHVKPSSRPKTGRMNMAVIGDSFCWPVMDVFEQSGQFSDIDFYFWYRAYKTRFAGKGRETVRTPAFPLDFNSEIFAADCLLLELNEPSAVTPEHPLADFIKDALAHLPDPMAPKPAFRAN